MNNYIIKNLLHYKLKTNLSVLSMEKAENTSEIDNQQTLENQMGFLKEKKTIEHKSQSQYDKLLNTSLKPLFKLFFNSGRKDHKFPKLDLKSQNKNFIKKIEQHIGDELLNLHDCLPNQHEQIHQTIRQKCCHIASPMEKLLKIPFNWEQTHETSLSNTRELCQCIDKIDGLFESMFTTNLSDDNSNVDQQIKDQQKILDKLKNSNEKNIEHMQTTKQKINSIITCIKNYKDSNQENNKEIYNNLCEWKKNNTINYEPERACKIYLETFKNLEKICYSKRDTILKQQKALEQFSEFKTKKHKLLEELAVENKKLMEKYGVLSKYIRKACHPNKFSLVINYAKTRKKNENPTNDQSILTIFQRVFGIKDTTLDYLSDQHERIEKKNKQYKSELNSLQLKTKQTQAKHPLEFTKLGINYNISAHYFLCMIKKYFKDHDDYINDIVKCENDSLLNEIVSLIATTCCEPTKTLWNNKLKAIVRFLAKKYMEYSYNNKELAMETSALVIFFNNSFYDNKNQLDGFKKLLLSNNIKKLETINKALIKNLKKLQDKFEEIKNKLVNDDILKYIIKPFLEKLYDQQNFIQNHELILANTIFFVEDGLQCAFAKINKSVDNNISDKNVLQKYVGGLGFMYSCIFSGATIFDIANGKIPSNKEKMCNWNLEKILNLTEDNLTNMCFNKRIIFFMSEPLNDNKYFKENYFNEQNSIFIKSIKKLQTMLEYETESTSQYIKQAHKQTIKATMQYRNIFPSLIKQRNNIINLFNLMFNCIQQNNSSFEDLCVDIKAHIDELENPYKKIIETFKQLIADLENNQYFKTQKELAKYGSMENCDDKDKKISRAKKHMECMFTVNYILKLIEGTEELIKKQKKHLQCIAILGRNLNKLLCEKNVGKKVVTEINKHFISFLKHLYQNQDTNDQNNNLHKIKNNSLSNDVTEKTDADFILSHKDLVSSIKKGLIAEQERTNVLLQQQYKQFKDEIEQIESMIEEPPFIKSKKEKIETKKTIGHFKNIYQRNLSSNDNINTHSELIKIMFENSFLTEDCKFDASYQEVYKSIKQQQGYNESDIEIIEKSKIHFDDIEHLKKNDPINGQFLCIIERLFNIYNCMQNILQKQEKILDYISKIKNLSLRKEEFNEETLTKEYNKLLGLLLKHIALDIRITKS